MTLLECLQYFLITQDSSLAAKLPGGLKPRLISQTSTTPFATTGVVRMVTGAGERPTLDGGASPWCRARIEITVWGTSDKLNEQASIAIVNKFLGYNSYLGGSSNGRFGCSEIQGPRHLTDEQSRLGGVQVDIIGMLNRATLS